MAQIRKPAVAGQWYPNNVEELKQMLNSFFNNVHLTDPTDEPIGIISPHAGFAYSGQVAAHGYSLIQNKPYDTIILLGSSHHFMKNEISVYNGQFYETPYGKIPIDKKIAKRLIKSDKRILFEPKIHKPEHSIEAQLPFLQYKLNNFKIVPILTSSNDLSLLDILANELYEIVQQNSSREFLFVCSTDMSHYHTDKIARRIDALTIDLILQNRWNQLKKNILTGKCELCGYYALYSFLNVMKHLSDNNAKLLKYANSGDISGNKLKVVGYSSIIFNKKKEKIMEKNEQIKLLKIARNSIANYLENKIRTTPQKPDQKFLSKERAVFVTLHKHGKLRGCIGHMQAKMPLYKAVAEMAVSAAFEDPRFSVLKREELEQIEIEISVLSPMQRIHDYKKIRMGIDGVLVKKGFRSGVYLPQVAEETGWDQDTFLRSLCTSKAGLSGDSYKDPATELYVFQVEKFSE